MQPKTLILFKGKWCPDGWMRFRNSCYFKGEEKKEWYESRKHCQEREADLVIINSKAEQVGLFVDISLIFTRNVSSMV